ncbi:uncharacterized protein LOC126662209 isoform X1 [Mercurialis annua]|uniref:uncharacterized protein LOC126662209 isoform X1 n=1 Tax=Mercurialis annua TaxID=3986 RepID=UPI0024AFACF6|nr:uncharacterized protein LOC126662209 isoform X1 [Mercurialis annua]
MGAGRKTQTIIATEKSQPSSWTGNGIYSARNLREKDLAAVIFGCKHSTIQECFENSIFGIPAPHYTYVKNINPGLPLFLFNYSDRKLHGLYEAASNGRLNINPQAWTEDGSDSTPYPAQVKFRTKMQCQPLSEDQFGPILAENYHAPKYFWFELDQNQTKKLISLFSSFPMTQKQNSLLRGSFGSNAREKQRLESQVDNNGGLTDKDIYIASMKPSCGISYSSIVKNTSSSVVQRAQPENHSITSSGMGSSVPQKPWTALFNNEIASDPRREIEESKAEDSGCGTAPDSWQEAQVSNLQEDSYTSDWSSSSVSPSLHEEIQPSQPDEEHLDTEANSESLYESMATMIIAEDSQVELAAHTTEAYGSEPKCTDFNFTMAKLLLEVEELKGSHLIQARKIDFLEQELIVSRVEMQHLKGRCEMLESSLLNTDELLLIAGGYDGSSWLSNLDSYSPFKDLKQPLVPMNFARSHTSAANLNGELFVFGGVHGDQWYDTVDSYNPTTNQWISRPSLNRRKGHLSGVSLNNKIFAVGGGNEEGSLSDVEMLDVNAAKWISVQSMLEKRYAPAAAEIGGIIYVAGGYNESGYLNSVERYDPREHSWIQLGSLNMKRGWHSMVVLNEKLYALGGYDGKMLSTVEVLDPRVGVWIMEGSMSIARGYFGAVVMRDAIYAFGGLDSNGTILDKVERYKQNHGWKATGLKGIGKRAFFCTAAV